jgi:uncharacterized protein YkwD
MLGTKRLYRAINNFMRIFQIILIVFTIMSLYIIRSDIVKAYHIISGFVVNELRIIENKSEGTKNTKSETGPEGSSVILGLHKFIDTPGALRVVSSIVQSGELTKDGVIASTNKNRKEVAGLPALVENSKLNKSAEAKVKDMFAKQYFEHVSPSGVGVSDLAEQQGYEFIIIGENLALGNFKNDDAVLTAWMNSPGHRANILNNKYTQIGVAVGKGTFEGKEVWLAVQHFGLPKSACPSINEVLKTKIELSQKRIISMQEDLAIQKKNIDSGGVHDGKTQQEQIEAYNAEVGVYNNLVAQIKASIEQYNAGVRAFNACVEANT